MSGEIKEGLILGLKLLTTGFLAIFVLGFAFIAATILMIKYRDDIRCLYKHGTLEVM